MGSKQQPIEIDSSSTASVESAPTIAGPSFNTCPRSTLPIDFGRPPSATLPVNFGRPPKVHNTRRPSQGLLPVDFGRPPKNTPDQLPVDFGRPPSAKSSAVPILNSQTILPIDFGRPPKVNSSIQSCHHPSIPSPAISGPPPQVPIPQSSNTFVNSLQLLLIHDLSHVGHLGWTPEQYSVIQGILQAHHPGASVPPSSPLGLEFLRNYEKFIKFLESTCQCYCPYF